MKKLQILLLAAVLTLCLAACAGGHSQPEQSGSDEQQQQQTLSTEDTVTINLPISLIDEQYQNDLEGYCEQYGYHSAVLSRDGSSVEITMNALSHELLLTQIGLRVLNAISEITDTDEYPAIKQLKDFDREGFSRVVVTADEELYKKEGSMPAYIIGQSCLLYQAYTTNTEYRCEVVVENAETGEVIDTQVYTDRDE